MTDLPGPRRWVIALPVSLVPLNSNQQLHHMVRHKRVKAIREAAAMMARAQRVPRLERCRIDGEYRPSRGGRRDKGNWYPSYKAAIDGFVDAGVVEDDDSSRVDGPHMDIGPIDPQAKALRLPHGRLVLTIIEILPDPGGE
jgi:hypothetical protein